MHVTEGGDLTSLHWLQELSVVRLLPGPDNASNRNTLTQKSSTNDIQEGPPIDYRKSPAKPPYSYATLICMAITANGNKITLARIYAWIRENFLYYRTAHPSWQNLKSMFENVFQNSIRHNLSLNKCFVKIPRTEGEKGKGGFWCLDLDRLEQGRRSRRRRLKPSQTNGKKICTGKSTNTDHPITTTTNTTPTCSDSVINVNSTTATTQVPSTLNPPLPVPGPSTNLSISIPETGSENVIVEPLLLAEDDLATLFLVESWDEELLNSLLDNL